MKHILNNITESEKESILKQHQGGMKVNTERFNSLLESGLGNVKPLISEQGTGLNTQSEPPSRGNFLEDKYVKPLVEKGYKEVTEINLPDGTYEKGGSGYQIEVNQYGKQTGYIIVTNSGIRGMWSGPITVTGKKPQNTDVYKIFFKDIGFKPADQTKIQKLVNKVSTEGIKNVTEQMVASPPFVGTYSGYVFGGTFNGISYSWDCSGVEGMSGIRGQLEGQIVSESNSHLNSQVKQRVADKTPDGVWVGFYSDQSKFVIYTTTENKVKCIQY